MTALSPLVTLFDRLVEILGPGWALVYAACFVLLALTWRVVQDRRRDRWANRALEEKEKTVQRLAKEAREWRIYWMIQEGGMTRAEATAIVQENEFRTPHEAREALEEPPEPPKPREED